MLRANYNMATGESSPEEIILQYMIMLKVVEGD